MAKDLDIQVNLIAKSNTHYSFEGYYKNQLVLTEIIAIEEKGKLNSAAVYISRLRNKIRNQIKVGA